MNNETGLRVLECSGTAYDIGLQYGKASGDKVHSALELLVRQLKLNLSQLPADIEKACHCARRYVENVRSFDPEAIQWVQGIADGATIPFDEALLLPCYAEILFNFHILSGMCTSFAVTGPATKDGITILGQNIDWHPETPLDLLRIKHADGLEQLSVAFFGAPVITLTSAGIGNCGNLTLSHERPVTTHVPFAFAIMAAMRRGSFEEVLEVLKGSVRGIEYFHLADARGNMAGMESVHDDYTILYPNQGVLVHANHYETPGYAETDVAPMFIPDSFHRASRLRYLIDQHYGTMTPEVMMTLLADHDGRPHSICAHKDPEKPYEFATISAASVIMVPAERKMYVSSGQPCKNRYKEYSL